MSGNGQQDIKRDRILEAAYKRFLQFGYSKTTMNDIAGDISLSKALLYYYFPDKSRLYTAVMRRMADQYLTKLEEKVKELDTLKAAIIFQVDEQHNFVANNYNFFDYFRLNEQNLPADIWDIIIDLRRAEVDILSSVLDNEFTRLLIKPIESSKKIVDLLLDALQGVRVSVVGSKKMLFPQQKDLDEIHAKRLLLIDIFIKGLMN
jgi:AcrR family transcriptional regulator